MLFFMSFMLFMVNFDLQPCVNAPAWIFSQSPGMGFVIQLWDTSYALPFCAYGVHIVSLLYFLIIGALAGWLGGMIMRGGGLGLFGNLVVGIIGAFIGGYVFDLLGISVSGGFVGPLLTSTAGAVILLFVVGLFKK